MITWRVVFILISILCMACCSAQDVGMDRKTWHAKAVVNCMKGCTKSTQNDPLSSEWKMSEKDIEYICSCQCEHIADHASPEFFERFRGQSKSDFLANEEIRRMTTAAQQACYPKFLESRNIKIK